MVYESDSDSDSSLNEEDVQNFLSLVKKDSQAKKHKRPKMKQPKDKAKDELADMLTNLSLKKGKSKGNDKEELTNMLNNLSLSKSDADTLADMLNGVHIKNTHKSKKN